MDKRSLEEFPPAIRQAFGSYILQAQSEVHRLDSEFHERFADTQWPDNLKLIDEYCLKRFDLCASQLSFSSVSDDPTSINPLYEQYLDLVKGKCLKFLGEVLHPLRSDLREEVLSQMGLKLSARKLWWLADAEQRASERPPTPAALADAQEAADPQGITHRKSRRGRKKGTGSKETYLLNKGIKEAREDGASSTREIVEFLARREQSIKTPLLGGWRKRYNIKRWADIQMNPKFLRLASKRFTKVKISRPFPSPRIPKNLSLP